MAISVLGIPTSVPRMAQIPARGSGTLSTHRDILSAHSAAIRQQYLHVVVVLGNARTVRRRAIVTAACV